MSNTKILNEVEQHIFEAIQQIKFGAVEVLIHDSKVVQIKRSEKRRFDSKKQTLDTVNKHIRQPDIWRQL